MALVVKGSEDLGALTPDTVDTALTIPSGTNAIALMVGSDEEDGDANGGTPDIGGVNATKAVQVNAGNSAGATIWYWDDGAAARANDNLNWSGSGSWNLDCGMVYFNVNTFGYNAGDTWSAACSTCGAGTPLTHSVTNPAGNIQGNFLAVNALGAYSSGWAEQGGATVVSTGASGGDMQETSYDVLSGTETQGWTIGGLSFWSAACGAVFYDADIDIVVTPDPVQITITAPAHTETGAYPDITEHDNQAKVEVTVPEPTITVTHPQQLPLVGVHEDMPGRVGLGNALTNPVLSEQNKIPVFVESSTLPASAPTHASTTGQTTDDHHAKSHLHNGADGSGTVAHSDTTGQGTDDHHAKSHIHDGVDGSGTVAHSATTGQGTDDHHAEAHTVASTGPHAQSGLTSGHFLRASAATAFDFAAIQDADVPASHSGSTHAAVQAAAEATAAADTDADISTHEGLADPHTGYRLESADHTHATTGLQGGTIAHSVTTGQGTDDHHAEAHTVASTGPHAQSGLTAGHFLRASAATAFDFAAIQDSDVPASHSGSTHAAVQAAAEATAAADVDADIITHAAIAGAHHAKYLDSEAVSAVEAANPLTLAGNLDAGAGVDVTGNITVTGTVDGVDIATRDALLIPDTTVTTKGDLLTATASATLTRRPVGTDGHVLIADSAEADGVKWGAAPAGTPASTVTDETSFGIATAVGVNSEYARQDHTHGSPTNPVTAHAADAGAHHAKYLDSEAVTAVESHTDLALADVVSITGLAAVAITATTTLTITAASTDLSGAGTITLGAAQQVNSGVLNPTNFYIPEGSTPAPTTAGHVYFGNTYDELAVGDGAASEYFRPAGASAEANADQEFTATGAGTWTAPLGHYTWVRIICIGGGGGGGSGRRGANGTKRVGGGGGGGGGVTIAEIPWADVAASYAVNVGAGGAGGAGHSSNSTNGNGGTNGGDTWVGATADGAIVSASGGQAGAAGQDSERAAAVGGEGTSPGMHGGAGDDGTGDAAGVILNRFGGGDNVTLNLGRGGGAGGGGGGGGLNTGDSEANGGTGGKPNQLGSITTDGTAGTLPSTAAGAGNDISGYIQFNKAGGGGGGGTGTLGADTGNAGGDGGLYGGGGGGGGAQNNSGTTAAGGDGADGYIRIICY